MNGTDVSNVTALQVQDNPAETSRVTAYELMMNPAYSTS